MQNLTEETLSKALSPTSQPRSTVATDYLKAAKIILGSSRTGEANDPEIYIAMIVRVLSEYPIHVAMNVAETLPSKLDWLPKPKEVRDACEALHRPVLYLREYDKRSAEQLAERKQIESQSRPKQTYEEFCAEMAQRGLPISKHYVQVDDIVDVVRTKHGLTQEQWDALPDLPKSALDKSRERLIRR